MMRKIARLSIRHPRPVLAVWGAAFLIALLFASNARDNLNETDLQIEGTPGHRASTLTEREFGGTISMAVLLNGPTAELDRQGPKLVRRLQKIRGVQVLSPWDVSGQRTLREPAGQALLTLQVKRPFQAISDDTTPAVERELRRSVAPPVKAELTGLAPLMRALNSASLDSLDQGELIALPLLVVLLLLVFRSPVAALIPALAGLLVTRIGTALMGVLNHSLEIDALALNMVTMIGLALGVDYSLLIVSRFREELAAGKSVFEAAEQSVARAGRTVLFAGSALAFGMLGALAVAPGALLVSATMGVIVATVLAVLVALFAIPAGLAVAGASIDRWQFGRSTRVNPWVRLASRVLAKPGAAAFFVLLPLAVLSAPAIGLDTGPPNVKNLPPDNPARQSFESFERERGAGWAAPYEITFKTPGPITTGRRLAELGQFQSELARQNGVEAVLGPAELRRRSESLRGLVRQLAGGSTSLARLARGLNRALKGTGALREGLAQSAGGADQLVGGLDAAAAGSGQLSSQVAGAAPETDELASGVKKTGRGAGQAASGASEASNAAKELQQPASELSGTLNRQNSSADTNLTQPLDNAQSEVQSALRALGSASADVQADANVARAKQDLQDAVNQLSPLKTNLSSLTTDLDSSAIAAREISSGVDDLVSGLEALATGTESLDSGIAKTSSGATQLASGVDALSGGSQQLQGGILALLGGSSGDGGARALASGLDRALVGADALGRGLTRLRNEVVEVRASTARQSADLRRSGTDPTKAVRSGYLVLSGIEGSRPQTRTNLSFAIDTDSGGDTARVIVVPKTGPFDQKTVALRPELERLAEQTGKRLGAEASLVGGPAVVLDDFDRSTSDRFPYLVAILILITFLVLLVVFRSPVLSLIAVLLNMVTVGAAVGVMILVFQTDPPILGGPGYLDAIALSGIFAIIFGLSIDYEVFLISRLLEGRALTGTTEGAINYGLEKTATIITGAAAIMAGVFIAFAISPVANTRQFGVGLTVAVVLDATVVRLVLLPALIKLFGERTWVVPKWLDRVLPRFSPH